MKKKEKYILFCIVGVLSLLAMFFKGGYYSQAATSNTVNVALKKTSSWDSNGISYFGWEFTVTNGLNKSIGSWSVRLPVTGKEKISQLWNTTGTISNHYLECKSMSYNGVIEPGSSVSFGGIFTDADTLSTNSVQVNYELQSSEVTKTNESSTSKERLANHKEITIPKATTNDWLYAKGNKIVNKNGTQVFLTGLNWFGYNTGTNCLDGLWASDLITSVQAIADKGFNLIRVPISCELILNWKEGIYPNANYNSAINSYLNGKNSLQILDYFVSLCRANGIKIMFGIHSAKTDPQGHLYPLWYNGSITEKDYINSLTWLAKRYKNDDTVIAFDLKNEPHGGANDTNKAIWNNSKSKNNWKYVAEKTALQILKVNPNALIIVSGIEIYPKNIKQNSNYTSKKAKDYYYNWWGGNLRGVKDYPINLGKYQNKLIYSPHDYGPSVYNQPWFQKNFTYQSLMKDCWKDNWFYIHQQSIAPVFIGEWGGYMTEPNLKWMTYLRKLIKTNQISHTYWCYNANSGDTGGLIKDDFKTWDMEKYNFVKEVLWQSYGDFVGLDSEIPLGKNGITLSSYEKRIRRVAKYNKLTKKTVPVLSKVTKFSGSKLKISYRTFSGADGYVIYISTKKSSGYRAIKKVTNPKQTSYVTGDLKKNRTYYIKIRAYIKVGDKRLYSKYSVIKKIKI